MHADIGLHRSDGIADNGGSIDADEPGRAVETTSLPELVASLAAIQIGAYDLAVGNLFGSNAFNMTIPLAADVAYRPGPILAAVEPSLVVAGVGAILLMAIALAAVVHGTRTRIRRLEPDAVAVPVVYVLLLAAVWRSAS